MLRISLIPLTPSLSLFAVACVALEGVQSQSYLRKLHVLNRPPHSHANSLKEVIIPRGPRCMAWRQNGATEIRIWEHTGHSEPIFYCLFPGTCQRIESHSNRAPSNRSHDPIVAKSQHYTTRTASMRKSSRVSNQRFSQEPRNSPE